ncbi:hypothetical protein SCOCK_30304 [Actinacidiphila cocklensis]|uniref:Uncharacterized protein n=1 Tax=Actinacidiphila cocklensis TaxID=887465 RepID=A0A9W4DRS6_9ACTN|nr:hypothetical protein SCOCK_30304 [Actinacidiphila cocklensis]
MSPRIGESWRRAVRAPCGAPTDVQAAATSHPAAARLHARPYPRRHARAEPRIAVHGLAGAGRESEAVDREWDASSAQAPAALVRPRQVSGGCRG